MEIFPIRVGVKTGRFDLFETLYKEFQYRDGDVLVVSSKFVSMSEGAVVNLDTVKVSKKAKVLASKYKMDGRLAELVLRESDYILKGIPGFILTVRKGMIAPNAGIDKSNVPHGSVILYPKNPFKSARDLRQKFLDAGVNVAIVVADSRLMPTRIGTTGIAIAVAGIEPVEDQRGKKDLFGNVLRVTFTAVADCLATMGVSAMGESNESTPAAVVRGAKVKFSDKNLSWKDMAVKPEIDIYMRVIKTENI